MSDDATEALSRIMRGTGLDPYAVVAYLDGGVWVIGFPGSPVETRVRVADAAIRKPGSYELQTAQGELRRMFRMPEVRGELVRAVRSHPGWAVRGQVTAGCWTWVWAGGVVGGWWCTVAGCVGDEDGEPVQWMTRVHHGVYGRKVDLGIHSSAEEALAAANQTAGFDDQMIRA